MEQQIREIKDQRSKVIVAGKENVKIVFCTHLREKWIDLRSAEHPAQQRRFAYP